MSRYAHVRSLDHAERIMREQARKVRGYSEHETSPLAAAAMRGKAVAYSEAADLIAVLRRKLDAGDLDEARTILREAARQLSPRIHVGTGR